MGWRDRTDLRFSMRTMFVVLAVAAIMLGWIRWIVLAKIEEDNRHARMCISVELSILDDALIAWMTNHGYDDPPPSRGIEIEQDWKRRGRELPPGDSRRLADLDPREALVFWLSNSVNQTNDAFLFDPRRLEDGDRDGWLEYRSYYGPYYFQMAPTPALWDPETGRTTSRKQLETELRRPP